MRKEKRYFQDQPQTLKPPPIFWIRLIGTFVSFLAVLAILVIINSGHPPEEIMALKTSRPDPGGFLGDGEDIQAKIENTDQPLFYGNLGHSEPTIASAAPQQEAYSHDLSPSLPSGPPRYALEIQETHDQTEAQTLISRLKQKGIEAYYTPLHRGGQVIYRVRTGIFGDPHEAAKHQDVLKVAKSIKSRIIKLD